MAKVLIFFHNFPHVSKIFHELLTGLFVLDSRRADNVPAWINDLLLIYYRLITLWMASLRYFAL